MLLIKEKNVSNSINYVLEDGTELYEVDWNGEIYSNGFKDGKDTNCTYKPVYRFQVENIDLDTLEENSKEYDEASEIIGFEQF